MPVNPSLIKKVANQILGLPECDSMGVQLDVNGISISKYPFVIPFNGPSGSGMLFRLVFNPKGEFIGFSDGRTNRKISVSEDGKMSDADVRWLSVELSKRNVNLRSVVIKLMTTEKDMEANRGVNYYEQFPKFSLRQMVSQPVLRKLVGDYLAKTGQKIDDRVLEEELKTKSDEFLLQILTNAFSNFATVEGIPLSEDDIASAINNNRVELVKLLENGVSPFKAIKYVYNKNNSVEHINTDDIVVIDSRTKKQASLGQPDGGMASMLMAPLDENSSVLVDVGYLQGGDRIELFYRVGIADGNVTVVRYMKPDENGTQKLSSVKSKVKLEDFSGIADWVGNTVSSLYEVDHDVEDVKPGNLNIYIGEKPRYPREFATLFNSMNVVEVPADAVNSDYGSENIIEAKFVRVPSSMGSKAIEFLISGNKHPVIVMNFNEKDEFSADAMAKDNEDGSQEIVSDAFINVDAGDEVEIRYLSSYKESGTYATTVAPNAQYALRIAHELCVAYLLAFDFVNGLSGMTNELKNISKTYINPDEIFAQFAVKPYDEYSTCIMTVVSEISPRRAIIESAIQSGDDGSCHVAIGFRSNPLSNKVTPLELGGESLVTAMSDTSGETFEQLSQIILPVITATDFGTVKQTLTAKGNTASEANKAADMKRREQLVQNAGPEVDMSNAMENLKRCKYAFINTFTKYGVKFKIGDFSVSRNPKNNSLIGCSFAVDDGSTGSFVAVPEMAAGNRTGNSLVYYMNNGVTLPVTYKNPSATLGAVTFSDDFVKRFLNNSGSLQSTIRMGRKNAI